MLILLACVLSIFSTSLSVEDFERFPFNGKIVGGHITTIEEHPYQVLIKLYNSSDHLSTCGGSIISDQWILTAAHCLYKRVKGFVHAGSVHSKEGGVKVPVFLFLTPTDYVHGTFNIDVGLIQLTHKLYLETPQMKSISLSYPGLELPEGIETVITGWGTTYPSKKSSALLMEVTVPIISRQRCQNSYPDMSVTMNMICAGHEIGGKDSCKGDSGGPMVFNNIQVGIVSWGKGCGLPGYPGVYTNVAAVRNWIRINSGV